MKTTTTDKTKSRFSGFVPPGVCVASIYLMVAYLNCWWPIACPQPQCPIKAARYHLFIDSTGSNKDKSNWQAEAERFAQTLGSCDRLSFWPITDSTPSSAQFEVPIVFPVVNPNAPTWKRIQDEEKIKELRRQVQERIERMMVQPGSDWSDIIGLFSKLRADENSPLRNVLVVFSDGKESNRKGLNLEDGHFCVRENNLESLLEAALKNREYPDSLGRFAEIKWVVPTRSGITGCNSRDELQRFWRGAIRRWASEAKTPDAREQIEILARTMKFDTNVF